MSKTLLKIAGQELDAVDILKLSFQDYSAPLMLGPTYNPGLLEVMPEEELRFPDHHNMREYSGEAD